MAKEKAKRERYMGVREREGYLLVFYTVGKGVTRTSKGKGNANCGGLILDDRQHFQSTYSAMEALGHCIRSDWSFITVYILVC